VDPLAGSGYWAYLMAQCGVDVIAADAAPPTFNQDHNRWHYHGQHITVHKANAFDTVCEAHPQRSLLLSWPPYDAPIGVEVLRAFRGDRVVYIGEGEGGCCGDDVMFELLAAEWVEVTDHRPVQWYGIHDWITVYDPATDALIDASIVMHRNPRARAAALAELDAEPTRLKIGVAEFARRAGVNRA
jgi:hypothetical protein